MAWLKLDDGFPEHEKILALKRSERWTWLELLAFAARRGNGGHVSVGVCDTLRWVTPAFLERCAEVGLLDVHERGYRIHDWDEYNPKDPTKASRQARWRAKRDGLVDTPVDDDVDGTVDADVDNGSVYKTVSRAQPRARGPSPTPTPSTDTSSSTSSLDPVPAAAAERLRQAGWSEKQIRECAGSLELGARWLTIAERDPSCTNPGALAWTKTVAGLDPGAAPDSSRPTLAAGATGTRSISVTKVVCPHCGVGKAGPAALAEHVANVHWDLEDDGEPAPDPSDTPQAA